MNYANFKTFLQTKLKKEKDQKGISVMIKHSIPRSTLSRYLVKLRTQNILFTIHKRDKHPKRFPITFYFINPIYKIEKK